MLVMEPNEFDRFRDYLGLASLITKIRPASPETSPASKPSQDHFCGHQIQNIKPNDSSGTGFRPFTIDELSREIRPTRREQRWVVPKPAWCVFCKNNGETEAVYTSHVLKNSQDKVACPRLRAYVCPLCGVSGDDAHTIKYYPTNLGSLRPEPSKTKPSLGMFIGSRTLLPTATRVSA